AAREGATLFMTLLAAFDLLLHRWSGQRDLVVGTPIANRTHADTEALVGFFVNTLVLRANVDPEASFRDLLLHLRARCLGAFAHHDPPFQHLAKDLAPSRAATATPLFQVMFALQTAPAAALALGDTRRRAVHTEGATAKFDLNLALADGRGGLSGALEFAT